MFSGSFGIRCVPATLDDLPFIDRLRRRDSAALGFLSHRALIEKIRLGFVLLAWPGAASPRVSGPIEKGDHRPDAGAASARGRPEHHSDITRPLGFVLHGSLRRPEVRVFQLAVEPDYRGHGVARRLLAELLRRCRRIGAMGVSLRCREELAANRFWHRAGFLLHDLERGRRGALFVWVKRICRNEAIGFHSRWHPCPTCERMTCGSWSAGGVRRGICDACAAGQSG